MWVALLCVCSAVLSLLRIAIRDLASFGDFQIGPPLIGHKSFGSFFSELAKLFGFRSAKLIGPQTFINYSKQIKIQLRAELS